MVLEIILLTLTLTFGILLVLVVQRWIRDNAKHAKDLRYAREDAVKKSRATIEGQTYEQLAPILPDWKYTPSDCKFMSAPVDYIVFSGLSTNTVEEIIILEIKTGDSQPTARQRSIRDAIKNGKVRYEVYRIKDGREVTKETV
jgi:predicted Holliday junction resolvase-like endonuclease